VTVPYAALEAFEADNQSRMYYRVSTPPAVRWCRATPTCRCGAAQIPDKPPYAALVDFYDAPVSRPPVRVAVLLQPVASANGRGMAVIQVAETLELRQTLARASCGHPVAPGGAGGRDCAWWCGGGAARHAPGAALSASCRPAPAAT
jgi:hypothetical protein